MMFILFGTKQVAKDVKDATLIRKFCPKCALLSDMKLQRIALYFTVWFVPLFRISKVEEVHRCSRCHGTFYPDTNMTPPPEYKEERAVIICPDCGGKCGIPGVIRNAIRVTCPRCNSQFEVSMRSHPPA
jgi:uncharacterized CHY-type Zn-finger protein